MKSHAHNYFVTLTYDDDHLPPPGTLDPEHLRIFWKELRRQNNVALRYFACGEYGEKKGRPHYHAIVFTDDDFKFKFSKSGLTVVDSHFHRSWVHGNVDVRTIVSGANKVARYVAGYTLKTNNMQVVTENPERFQWLPGFHREFARFSRKPGIGAPYVSKLARQLKDTGVGPPGVDLPSNAQLQMIRIDGKLYPLARSLRNRLYRELGGDWRQDNRIALDHHAKSVAQERNEWRDPITYQTRRDQSAARAEKRINKRRKALVF